MAGLNGKALTYLITRGNLNEKNFSTESANTLEIIEAAVNARITFIQIREKNIEARSVFELASKSIAIAKDTGTKIFVNERFDIALSAGVDGVHLTSRPIPIDRVRAMVPNDFIIGLSAHSLQQATNARDQGADFATFSPIYSTATKAKYGEPQGIQKLREVTEVLKPFPIIALGGINSKNYRDTLEAGAAGFAGISFFNDPSNLRAIA